MLSGVREGVFLKKGMKQFVTAVVTVLGVCCFFSVCYYGTFLGVKKRMEERKLEQTQELRDITRSLAELPFMTEPLRENRVAEEAEPVSFEDAIITSKTVCVYELIYLDTGEKLRYEAPPGSDIAGLTGKQLERKLKKYMEELPVMEYEEGLVSYDLVSFSPTRVVMQKVYDRDRIRFRYYVILRGPEVVVFYSDKKTVFEYTGILRDSLPEEFIPALELGIPVKDIEELYDYLSGITS